MESRKIIISGRVCGVGFRNFVYVNAIKLGIKGYVRNKFDNEVEIIANGNKEKINELVNKCRIGPSNAVVDDIKVEEVKKEEFKGFNIRY